MNKLVCIDVISYLCTSIRDVFHKKIRNTSRTISDSIITTQVHDTSVKPISSEHSYKSNKKNCFVKGNNKKRFSLFMAVKPTFLMKS